MKSVGITRRIDELGRIVIPKEIRNNLNIKKGDLLEIFLSGSDEISLKKHSVISENMGFISDYINCLSKHIKSDVFISNKEKILFSSNNLYINENLNIDFDDINLLENKINNFKITYNLILKKPFKIIKLNPNGDLIGYIIINEVSDDVLSKNADIIKFTEELINNFFETK